MTSIRQRRSCDVASRKTVVSMKSDGKAPDASGDRGRQSFSCLLHDRARHFRVRVRETSPFRPFRWLAFAALRRWCGASPAAIRVTQSIWSDPDAFGSACERLLMHRVNTLSLKETFA